jgi:DNA-binding NtrC family response regulator
MNTMNKQTKVLIIEDDHSLRETVRGMLTRRGFNVDEAGTIEQARKKLIKNPYDLALLDLTFPDGCGLDILEGDSFINHNRIIVVSGTAEIQTAVNAMKMGVFDFLTKPIDRDLLLATIAKVLEVNQKLDNFQELKKEVGSDSTFEKILYKSKVMGTVLKRAKEIAISSNTTLITGETGTGKELLARAIHNHSPRKDMPFIPVNCAAIPENLAESEFFGFEAGAFTGANKAYPGKFMLAENGTIFLDEIAELPLMIQAKLLRVLESNEIFALNSKKPKIINVRVIAATNKDLKELINNGGFREDLYYRINVLKLNLPPLRKRKGDIIPLAERFIHINNIAHNKEIDAIDDEAAELLSKYEWPGNVRELKNTITEISLVVNGTVIKAEHLPTRIINYGKSDASRHTFLTLSEVERNHIMGALKKTNYNIQRCAQLLGLTRPTLYKKMKDHCIQKL